MPAADRVEKIDRQEREDRTERGKAVELAVGQIEKQFGKGSIMRLGQRGPIQPIDAIPTGSRVDAHRARGLQGKLDLAQAGFSNRAAVQTDARSWKRSTE